MQRPLGTQMNFPRLPVDVPPRKLGTPKPPIFRPSPGGSGPIIADPGTIITTPPKADERRTGGIKPPFPVKTMPVDPVPLPPMSTPPSMDLFGPPGAGTYDAIMSRTAQDYLSQPSPYAGISEFLLNRPVFDRGPSPERQPMASPTPTFSYGNQAGAQGLAALSAQQPMMQEQYDRFAQQIQSAQEAAQQQAQQQTDLAASERQALMDRITALESQEGPDLDAFGAQLRQDILGQMPEQIDVDALRREITGEVLAVAQQDFPDVMQIRDEVMRLLPEQEQIDVENLRRQIQESIDAGAPPEQIEALRQELQNRIRPVEEQLASIQDERPEIARQLGELRGEIGAIPDIDVEQLRAQIISQLPEQERLDIEDLQRRIQESIDAGAPEQEIQNLRTELNTRLQPVEDRVGQIRESIGQLRAQVDLGPQIDVEDIRRQVQERLEDRFQSPDFNPNVQRQIDDLRRQFEEGRGRVDPDILERLRSVEQREAPDLSGIREQIGRLRGRLDERPTVDPDAIARRVRESIDVPQVDLSDIQTQIAALEDRGLPPEVLERLRAVEQREGPDLGSLREQIGQLRGRLDERPTIDTDAIARQVRESIELPQVDLSGIQTQIADLENRGLPPEILERLRAVEQREGPDLGSIREQIGELRGRLDQQPRDTGVVSPDVLERLRAVEQREGPDLSGITSQIAALENRGLPPEVLARLRAVEQREGPDEAAIAERVRSGIDPRIADLRERLGSVGDFSQSMREQIAALREQGDRATQERSTLEERLGARLEDVRGQVSPLTERIAELRGRLDERPTIDADAIARQVRESIDIPQVDLSGLQTQIAALENRGLPPEILERLRAVEQRKGPDLGSIREQIGALRGRLDERPVLDEAAITRRIKQSIKPQRIDVDALRRQIQEGIKVPRVDLSDIQQQLGTLQSRLDQRPQVTTEDVQRLIKQGLANRTTAGVKPTPRVRGKI